MAQLEIVHPTVHASMAAARPSLDAALQKQFPGGMLKRTWEGDVLNLSGPGASGTIVLDAGRLIGRASLGPPASMMASTIEEKVGAA
ncbi:MAG: polyhydroxyalkanoic acid system family protein, partial [Acidobacteriota bacterium]